MTPDSVMALGQQALTIVIMLAAPILLASLAVGLVIAMFQAATQINEMTLTFVPKLAVIAAVLFGAGSWMISLLVDYTRELFNSIPGLIG
jgi:flagellar biosynthetic protein FliQ